MKKNEKRKLWKQGLGTALVCGLAVAVFPAAKADAADLLKAGPINTTAEHVTQNQPFAERTAGSQYLRIPAFIVTQKGNLLAAADARYSTTGDGGGLEIGFNNRYLMEALRYAPADTVKIELNTGVSPAIIVPTEGEENFLYMVLPVRLKSAE